MQLASEIHEPMLILAIVGLALVGGMLSPTLTRPLQATVSTILDTVSSCVYSVMKELIYETLKWLAITVGVAAASLIATGNIAKAAATAKVASADATAQAAADMEITRLFLDITTIGTKPAPIWILESAARIYAAYKTYRNGEKVEVATRLAAATLREVRELRNQLDAGLQLEARERELAQLRFEGQADTILALNKRLTTLEDRTERLEKRLARMPRPRRGCPTLHAYDTRLQRCVNRQ